MKRFIAVLGLAIMPMILPTTSGAATYSCFGEAATIVGTAGNDTIKGTAGKDVIRALAGNDVVYAAGGHDVVCGDKGHDTLYGDRISATKVATWAESRGDYMSGGEGDDAIRANLTHGYFPADRITGNAGDDFLHAGGDSTNDDVFFDGNSPIHFVSTTFSGGRNGAVVTGQGEDQILYTPWVIGTSAGDTFDLKEGTSVSGLAGDEGDDVFNIDGNIGREDDGNYGGPGDDIFRIGPNGDYGSYLYGGPGSDTVYGTSGADRLYLYYDEGADTIVSYGGDDSLSAPDFVSGNDTLRAGDGFDTCGADLGDLFLECEEEFTDPS